MPQTAEVERLNRSVGAESVVHASVQPRLQPDRADVQQAQRVPPFVHLANRRRRDRLNGRDALREVNPRDIIAWFKSFSVPIRSKVKCSIQLAQLEEKPVRPIKDGRAIGTYTPLFCSTLLVRETRHPTALWPSRGGHEPLDVRGRQCRDR